MGRCSPKLNHFGAPKGLEHQGRTSQAFALLAILWLRRSVALLTERGSVRDGIRSRRNGRDQTLGIRPSNSQSVAIRTAMPLVT